MMLRDYMYAFIFSFFLYYLLEQKTKRLNKMYFFDFLFLQEQLKYKHKYY